MSIEIRHLPAERLPDMMVPIATAFGIAFGPEHFARMGVPELTMRLGAFDGEALVGGAGSFDLQMTVPGGVAVPAGGLTLVGVLPTHRRRGILRAMMREHLDETRRRGQPIAALFASEATIYGHFGYGIASLSADVELLRHHTAMLGPVAKVSARLLGEAEAAAAFAPIWERVRLSTPGMLARSEAWWRLRRNPDPESLRGGKGPLLRVLLSIDGEPSAYAYYRFAHAAGHRDPMPSIDVLEAVGDGPDATRAIWRYLSDIDIAPSVRATWMPVDHPLVSMLADVRSLGMKVRDALWVRLVDVGAALSARGYGPGEPLVIEVTDAFCPWNEGRYRIADGGASRTDEAADLSLGVDALAMTYLGAFGMTQLAAAGRAVELRAGALRRADTMLRGDRAPWCPETF